MQITFLIKKGRIQEHRPYIFTQHNARVLYHKKHEINTKEEFALALDILRNAFMDKTHVLQVAASDDAVEFWEIELYNRYHFCEEFSRWHHYKNKPYKSYNWGIQQLA
jgi:hypothetical protein